MFIDAVYLALIVLVITKSYKGRIKMKFTKIEVARQQLKQACKLYLNGGDLVSTLTLAGAAEEILGAILRRNGTQNAMQAVHSAELKIDPSRTVKQTADSINAVRNSIKHANNANETEVEFLPGDAYVMLARALENYAELAADFSEPMARALLKLQLAVGKHL